MADLRVDSDLLLFRLLPNMRDVKITGARFDGEHSIILTIEGSGVPSGCTEVIAIITQQQETVRLEPAGPSFAQEMLSTFTPRATTFGIG